MSLSSILKITSGAVLLASYASAAPATPYPPPESRALNPFRNRPGFHTIPLPPPSKSVSVPSKDKDLTATNVQLSKRVLPTYFWGNHPDTIKWGHPPRPTSLDEGLESNEAISHDLSQRTVESALTREEIWDYIILHPEEQLVMPDLADTTPVEDKIPRSMSHEILIHGNPTIPVDRLHLGLDPETKIETEAHVHELQAPHVEEAQAIEERAEMKIEANKLKSEMREDAKGIANEIDLPTYDELIASAKANNHTLREELMKYITPSNTIPVPVKPYVPSEAGVKASTKYVIAPDTVPVIVKPHSISDISKKYVIVPGLTPVPDRPHNLPEGLKPHAVPSNKDKGDDSEKGTETKTDSN